MVSNQHEIFDDTIENNIKLGREYEEEYFEYVLGLLNLREDFKRLESGMKTRLVSEGRNISLGQRQRILIARGLMMKPQLLILDEAFAGMDEKTKLDIVDNLYDLKNPWTILNITHDAELVSRSDRIFLLKDKKIAENDTLDSLIKNKDSEFNRLFPFLYKQLKDIGNE